MTRMVLALRAPFKFHKFDSLKQIQILACTSLASSRLSSGE